MRVFLAAGHTPRSPGGVAVDPALPGGMVTEHALASRITTELALVLRRCEPMVVPAETLRRKIAFVNRWCRPGDFAVEIHLNGFRDRTVHGAEVFHHAHSRGRARELAHRLLDALVAEPVNRKSRGVKTPELSARGALGWLGRTKPWAALVEVDFLSNIDARRWLCDEGYRLSGRALAAAIDGMV